MEAWISLAIREARAEDPTVVELGCGRTVWKDLPRCYVGLDLGRNALAQRAQPGVQGDMQRLPFRDASADFLFTIAALEHVPQPEIVLAEIVRIVRPGGIVLLAPAWFCRTWATKGLPVRSYAELGLRDRLDKATIPIRDSIPYRALSVFPRRFAREMRWRLRPGPQPFPYDRLEPNLKEYLMSDSDAFSSMDPHAALVYFLSRGYTSVKPKTRFLVRHEPLLLRAPDQSRQ